VVEVVATLVVEVGSTEVVDVAGMVDVVGSMAPGLPILVGDVEVVGAAPASVAPTSVPTRIAVTLTTREAPTGGAYGLLRAENHHIR
jgi:hypothetical protein